ncbi:MAG: thiamine-phosphate kinase [Myxococcota bacterium]
MQTLADIGERALIARIARHIERAAGRAPRSVALGIGDDAALLRLPARAGEQLVVSTDSVVEDVHFRWSDEAPATIGRRALVANLSDLAAMGARPLGFTVALAAPPELPVERVDGLARGLAREAAAFACPWVGGNLSRARETSLAIGILGTVEGGRALRRRDVRAGDPVFVTGALGGQALARLRAERAGVAIRRVPTPRLAAGRALGRLAGRGGCIDVSDGLARDLHNWLDGTGLGASIDRESLPRARAFDAACRRLGVDPEGLLVSGGEDYELLFSVRPRAASAARLARRLGVPVTRIGRIEGSPGVSGLPAGSGPGWSHF